MSMSNGFLIQQIYYIKQIFDLIFIYELLFNLFLFKN
jgi:hypothetical protein